MSKYKELYTIFVNSLYKTLCEILKSVLYQPTKESTTYFCMCFYEFVVVKICFEYKAYIDIRKLNDGSYKIDKTDLNIVFSKMFKNNFKQLNRVSTILVSNTNSMRHSYDKYEYSLSEILLLFNRKEFKVFCNLFLSDCDFLLSFLLNKDKVNALRKELLWTDNLYGECMEIIEESLFKCNILLSDIKNNLTERTGCSETFDKSVLCDYLKDYNVSSN